jgi:hypothetical protein
VSEDLSLTGLVFKLPDSAMISLLEGSLISSVTLWSPAGTDFCDLLLSKPCPKSCPLSNFKVVGSHSNSALRSTCQRHC